MLQGPGAEELLAEGQTEQLKKLGEVVERLRRLELAAFAEPVFRPAPPKHPEPPFFNATRIRCSSGHMLA